MKKTATWLAALCAALLALPVMGCKDELNSVAVESVALNTTTLTLAPGGTGNLTATVLPDNADDRTVKWSSSNTDVVMIDSDGTVFAIKAGIATIMAQAGGKTAVCLVTVKQESVAVERVALNTTTLTLAPTKEGKLTATVLPGNADDKTVEWSSSDTSVAVVDGNGTVVAIKVGTATITAKAGSKDATCTVIVHAVTENPEPVAVENVTLDATALMIAPGGTRKLTATVLPSDAEDKTVAWSSSNADVATVGNDGTVTAVKTGTATITAQAGGKTATCAVTVKPILIAVERVALNTTTLTLMRGETERLTATVLPGDAEDKTVAWSSSNADVVMVGNDGTVTAVKAGTATITARAGSKDATCTVTVQEVAENPTPVAVENVTLDATALTLARGTTRKLTATVTLSNADDKTVAWSSSDGTVATVGSDGTVTAVAKGRAIIIAQAGGKVAVCEVTVHIAVDQVTLDADTLTLVSDEARKLTAMVLPNNADDKTVKWSSSDETVATVDSDGTVTAVKVGTVTITASAGGKTAVCEVTVKFPAAGGFEIDEYGRLTKYSGTDATVVIPNGVTEIGWGVFQYCTGLTSVVIPDGVTEIGWGAFQYCTGLTSVTIPASVTSIGSSAFYGCTKLSTVIYGGTKEQWEAFEGKGSLNPTCVICTDGHLGAKDVPPYLTMSGTVVTGHTDGLPAELDIPDGVTEIWYSAFKGCTDLTSVKIPDSVTEIGDYAFQDCTGLTSVTIGNGVTEIGDYAFKGCTDLTGVAIGDSVTSIGSSAFNGCTGLTSVTIGDGVTSIGERAFEGCTDLTGVTIGDGVTEIGSNAFNGCTGLTSVTIGDGVTEIKSSVFDGCTNLTDVTIPNGVTSIGYYAFSGCTSLTNVKIPSSVTSIGGGAFSGCTGLESVTIPDSVTNIKDGSRYVSNSGVFEGCTNLKNVTIPASVTSIGSRAFKGCTGLTSVTIPDSVTSIGEYAFSGCTNLASVRIPSGLTSTGIGAFSECKIEHVTFGGTLAQWCEMGENLYFIDSAQTVKLDDVDNLKSMTELVIPTGVTRITGWAFSGCTGLTSVAIPSSVTEIGRYAFSGCTGLTSVTIPDSVTSIRSGAFTGCTGLESVTIPDSVTNIEGGNYGNGVFEGCTNLKNVTIPGSVTEIESRAFMGCTGLTSVTIPDSVTSIGELAFDGCTGLTSVTIGNGVTSIGDYAFYGCTNLVSVRIPSGLTSIGSGAFNERKIERVRFGGTLAQWCEMDVVLYNLIIYVQTVELDDVDNLKSMTELVIPTGVTRIGVNAFRSCTGLTSVTIGDCVTSIGDYAFSGCTGLTSVTIPSSVTSVGYNAFNECTSLTTVKYGGTEDEWNNVTGSGKSALSGKVTFAK